MRIGRRKGDLISREIWYDTDKLPLGRVGK